MKTALINFILTLLEEPEWVMYSAYSVGRTREPYGSSPDNNKDKKPRTFFPETWIWNDIKTESVALDENYSFLLWCESIESFY